MTALVSEKGAHLDLLVGPLQDPGAVRTGEPRSER